MRIKLSKTMWQNMGKSASWLKLNNPDPFDQPVKSERDSDFEVYNKWKHFKDTELEPSINKAILDIQLAIESNDKEKS